MREDSREPKMRQNTKSSIQYDPSTKEANADGIRGKGSLTSPILQAEEFANPSATRTATLVAAISFPILTGLHNLQRGNKSLAVQIATSSICNKNFMHGSGFHRVPGPADLGVRCHVDVDVDGL